MKELKNIHIGYWLFSIFFTVLCGIIIYQVYDYVHTLEANYLELQKNFALLQERYNELESALKNQKDKEVLAPITPQIEPSSPDQPASSPSSAYVLVGILVILVLFSLSPHVISYLNSPEVMNFFWGVYSPKILYFLDPKTQIALKLVFQESKNAYKVFYKMPDKDIFNQLPVDIIYDSKLSAPMIHLLDEFITRNLLV